jgi:hypothetical protein
MRRLLRCRVLQLLCSGLASLILLAAWPASAAGSKGLPSCADSAPGQQCDPNPPGAVPDPMPNWALSKVRYQRWANTVSFSGMPEMSGIHVLKELRKSKELYQMPVLMLTARDGDSDERIARFEGANDYVRKPFDPGFLVGRAEALMRGERRWD